MPAANTNAPDTDTMTRLDEQSAHDLFMVAIEGAATIDEDGNTTVDLVGAWQDDKGNTFTRTTGAYLDGQTCDGWHVRDADGEFVDFIAA